MEWEKRRDALRLKLTCVGCCRSDWFQETFCKGWPAPDVEKQVRQSLLANARAANWNTSSAEVCPTCNPGEAR